MKGWVRWMTALLVAACAGAGEPAPKPASPPENDADAIYEAGQQLFEALAPAEIKEQFEFPDRERWDAFFRRLQAALDGDDPAALAEFETEARTALAALRLLPGSEDYLDWLDERLDYIEAAGEMAKAPPPEPPPHPSVAAPSQFIPYYDLWLRRTRARARPAAADRYIRALQPIFAARGTPRELVWLAEVESGFNATAVSPAGARGLFQLMPATAKGLGLQTFLPDERKDPAKSADAAARMLRDLHRQFGDWPLALAAYNAGPGRVQRTLDKKKARTFAEIASALPLETRMYVPKVLAVLQVRAGVALAGANRRGKS